MGLQNFSWINNLINRQKYAGHLPAKSLSVYVISCRLRMMQ